MKIRKKKYIEIKNCDPSTGCCNPINDELSIPEATDIYRRDFMKMMGLGIGGLTLGLSNPLQAAIFKNFNEGSTVKAFNHEWLKSLTERGIPEIYSGKDLVYIGMPVGGICAGQVYLGGDGKLWLWDIFNDTKEGIKNVTHELNGRTVRPRDGSNFIVPVTQEYPFDQGFAVRVEQGNKKWIRSLDYRGFNKITFEGQYPIGKVKYKEENIPIEVKLNAFSPFVPLDVSSSSYPATTMQFTISNVSKGEVTCELSGWLENPVLNISGTASEVTLKNSIVSKEDYTALFCEALINEDGSQLDYKFKEQRDYGNMCLALMGSGKDIKTVVKEKEYSALLFPENNKIETTAEEKFGYSFRGGLSKNVSLLPGESKEVTFVISWYFPNLSADGNRFKGRSYSKRFKDALEVSDDIVQKFEELKTKTTLFKNTFYDNSTLPYWFLNRTFANTSTLATETCYLLEDGRFWGWEGIGCCPGTCTHVWHYAQAMARVFPELERNLRERTDFEVMENSGKIDFRGGRAKRDAADGQAGVVLRTYREHQMTSDHEFLQKNWRQVKLALQYLIKMDSEDGETNGMIYGEQHNTLDAEWYGNIPVITSLYLAALAAGKEMANEMKDASFYNTCSTILDKGQKNIETLFNGEYFVQNEDPDHIEAIGIGSGCYIDQVFGQSWAFQLGLGRLYNKEMIQKSLDALWKYNFVENMGQYRKSMPEKLAGRPYAIDDDSGLVMCTWPKGGKKDDWEKHWQFGYFNECMTGFEYEVAGHMIWENKVSEGLTLTKAIHDRYHPSKRNPYNEIECSDHYARAMASYGVYIATCGFSYHGPKKSLAFAPRITPENFQAGFIAAEGWGSFTQTQSTGVQKSSIKMVSGNIILESLSLEIPKSKKIKKINLKLNKKTIKLMHHVNQNKVVLNFNETLITEGNKLIVSIKY